MPETPTLDSLKQNGDFQALSDSAKQIVLSKWYPDYAKLSPDAQTHVMSTLKGEPDNPTLRGAAQATSIGPDTRPWYQRLEDWATHFVEGHRPGTDIAGLNDPRAQAGQTVAGNLMVGPVVGPARVAAGTTRLITGAPSQPDQEYPRVAAANEIIGGALQTLGPAAMLHPASLPAVVVGGATQQTVEKGASALGIAPEVSELAGNVAGIVAGAKTARVSAGKRIPTSKPAYSTPSETAPEAMPLKEAGQRIQQEAQAARDATGEALGAAKEKLAESLTRTAITLSQSTSRERRGASRM